MPSSVMLLAFRSLSSSLTSEYIWIILRENIDYKSFFVVVVVVVVVVFAVCWK